MKRFLLDTNIISLLAPGRPPLTLHVRNWFEANRGLETLYISTITLAEIERGIQKLRRKDQDSKARSVLDWSLEFQESFGQRILPLDTATARIAGRLDDHAQSIGRNPGLADILIAATAEAHGLILATANTKHFQPLGIEFVNPFEASGL